MAESFRFKPLWNDEDFIVQKGVLQANATVPGAELGDGVIYYPKSQHGTQQLTGVGDTEQFNLGESYRSYLCIGNSGRNVAIANGSTRSANVFRVELHYDASLLGEFSQSETPAATATAHLLSGEWSDAFKSSVKVDLRAIGMLAEPFGSHTLRSVLPATLLLRRKDILRAKRAKEDLEHKLAWLNAATREYRSSFNLLLGTGGESREFGASSYNILLGASGIGRGSTTLPPDGSIEVKVNTKSPKGGFVSDYEVWTNAYGNEGDEREAESFPKLSTPTTKYLSVGKYSMWSKKDGAVRGSRVVTIGSLDNPLKRDEEVDLTVR
jgi:hypothetical protein